MLQTLSVSCIKCHSWMCVGVLCCYLRCLKNVAWAAWKRTGQKADLHCVMCLHCPLEDGEDSGSLLCPCALPPHLLFASPLPRFFFPFFPPPLFLFRATPLSAPSALASPSVCKSDSNTTNRENVRLGTQTIRIQIDAITSLCQMSLQGWTTF